MPPRLNRLPGYGILILLLSTFPGAAQEQAVQVTLGDTVRTELAASLGLAADIIATQVSLPPESAAKACGVTATELKGGSCSASSATDEVRAAVMQAIEAGAAENKPSQ